MIRDPSSKFADQVVQGRCVDLVDLSCVNIPHDGDDGFFLVDAGPELPVRVSYNGL
jgi:hypothetical protein